MKFDSIIIGGGLSGLTAGIALLEAGQRVALVSYGRNTMLFNSGSLDLQGYDLAGQAVASPLDAIGELPATHPYKKVADVAQAAAAVQALLGRAGLKLQGDAKQNHWRLSPMGVAKPAWLSLDGMVTLPQAGKLPAKKVVVVDVKDYLDLPVDFLAAALAKQGAQVEVKTLALPELADVRRNASEFRAANIAKTLARPGVLDSLAAALQPLVAGAELALLPAVLGLDSDELATRLQQQVKTPVRFVATLPPSVPGSRIANALTARFQQLGGTILVGDKAVGGDVRDGALKSIVTANLDDETLYAQNFVLATGSFVSDGIVANMQGVFEPVLGLDIDLPVAEREQLAEWDVFAPQPYMQAGVAANAKLQVAKEGKVIANCYAAGSILAGNNRVKQGNGTGVSLLTGWQAAQNILAKK